MRHISNINKWHRTNRKCKYFNMRLLTSSSSEQVSLSASSSEFLKKSILCIRPLEKRELKGDLASELRTLLLFAVAVCPWIVLCTFRRLAPRGCVLFGGQEELGVTQTCSAGATSVHKRAAFELLWALLASRVRTWRMSLNSGCWSKCL